MSRKITNTELSYAIGQKLRQVRMRSQLTQQNVADDVGISATAYSKMENGKTDFSVTRLTQFAQLFKVYLPDFFDENIQVPRYINDSGTVEDYKNKMLEMRAQKELLKEILEYRLLKSSDKPLSL
ncbi:MAG: helix-turn-helix transcriptional regulator [Bacteroidales bacterium]|jgi:transcriptional regulator with XRE-family HTH domain|nr:helix-turn-helix transcriptional regulator [Bacteroidales bacterium]MDI9545613.1 helix-turn-helix transcriptional regulator [Bacteroidota bacterium]MBP8981441.1 helix-turn-helix transcriptional regulator [Bacteroidales bacterium]NLV38968.1 helix-turn-helix transcriptional regulator [Bacteroidales bacterium]HNZ81106.1 helix-turn-helix transcriptional regulator [Bacteroidales bacterium]